MKIGITGANGFIGWHMRCYLLTRKDVSDVRLAGRDVFAERQELIRFVDNLDVVIHLAGVNRATDKELYYGNTGPALELVSAMTEAGCKPYLIFSSSTQAVIEENAYTKGKLEASWILREWALKNQCPFVNAIIPHVFGEYCRPYYNSVVATFAHQIVHGKELTIHNNAQLELIHAQDLVADLVQFYLDRKQGDVRVSGKQVNVINTASLLQSLYKTYINDGQIPDLSSHFERCMFNTLKSAIDNSRRQVHLTKHEDGRGWIVETVKANSRGQCFVSQTRPGVTRGNHFHLRKIERFIVLQGHAEVRIRRLFTEDVTAYEMTGSNPSYVDIPTMHTHSIRNVGADDLIMMFWVDEFFDPNNPDTTYEEVDA